jgi:tetratricopeptide (TPR) repeat protein
MPGADPQPSPLSRPVALSEVIETHLEKIIGSDGFTSAGGLQRLLRFVVHEAIAGRGDQVKEYSLGVAVLGRGTSFDPKTDPIVRVQMHRLREHLARYYAAEGRHDPLVIDIPRGRYVPAFRVAAAAGAAGAAAEDERPLVGRQNELAALQSAFESAAAGRGRVICLSGESGIGKTTVADRFLRQQSTSGVRGHVGRGRCSERLVGSDAYLPVLEALDDMVRGGGEPLRRTMMEVAPSWYQQIVPGQKNATELVAEHSVASPERLKRELVAFLKTLAREHPVVLFLDDLHWADVSTVDALAYAGPRCTADRILIIGSFRPAELRTANPAFLQAKLELQAHDVCREIQIELLTRADVERYLALQFPDHRFPPELATRLHSRTEGNPLFMADLVRFLHDRGILARRDGHWAFAGELAQVEHDLPESVRSMVEKTISGLTDADRTLMAAAAVLGPQFASVVVARALALDASAVEQRLEALDRANGLVRLVDERVLGDATLTLEYRFVHVLYQAALFDALTATRKTALSMALAEALLAAHGKKSSEIASQVAWLFEAGRDFARAADLFLVASQKAAGLYAADQAIALARQSITNAERLEGRERDARVMAAALQSAVQHRAVTRLDAAIADFQLAERAAQALGDPGAQVNAIFGQAATCFLAKQIPEVKALGTRAMNIARVDGPPWAVASSTAILALEQICSGEVAAGQQRIDEAIPVLRESGIVHHALISVLVRGLLHTWHLEHQEAVDALEWARSTAADLHANFEVVAALWHQARARGNQGRLAEAWEILEGALRLADLLGDRYWRPRLENTRGWLLAELFDTEAALRLDTGAVQMARELGDVEAECNSHINAARDYLTLGEPHNARLHLHQAEALYQDDVWFRWVYYPRLQAEMAGYWLTQGDLRQAQVCARVSLEHAERTSSRKRIAWARKVLGDIAMLDDRPEEASREFESAMAVLAHHSCPIVEWQVLRSAAGAAGTVNGDGARRELLARAGAVVHSLGRAIPDAGLQAAFMRSKPVRELLDRSRR